MRQTGTTTQQMMAAPLNSIYVWCNDHLDYPRRIAFELGRGDLNIRSPSILNYGDQLGGTLLPIILDHDCHLTQMQLDTWIIYTQRRIEHERAVGKKAHLRASGARRADPNDSESDAA